MIACAQVSETMHALHPSIFKQPSPIGFFNTLLDGNDKVGARCGFRLPGHILPHLMFLYRGV
jgi:hypothetical protein